MTSTCATAGSAKPFTLADFERAVAAMEELGEAPIPEFVAIVPSEEVAQHMRRNGYGGPIRVSRYVTKPVECRNIMGWRE